ncbi:hypothetical protein [Halorussus salinisoli]|uniref:hypothetical protein n=1 Tax=Halorussus salinisoli TaxID=2558242 RepID=UPI002A91C00A|nr:hypothetical protein [Halorussus salinisoli]
MSDGDDRAETTDRESYVDGEQSERNRNAAEENESNYERQNVTSSSTGTSAERSGTGDRRPTNDGDDPASRDSTDDARTDRETIRTDREDARTDRETTRTSPDDPDGRDPDDHGGESDDGSGLTGGIAVAVAAVIALVVTGLAYLWVDGWFGGEQFFESLFRVAPTVSGGGVGTDWVVGNTVPILDAAIAITHAADVILGVFILGMVFIHWAIFRRLSGRMRRPAERETADTVATDGGARSDSEQTVVGERPRGDDR